MLPVSGKSFVNYCLIENKISTQSQTQFAETSLVNQ